jgi:hypothetical protein
MTPPLSEAISDLHKTTIGLRSYYFKAESIRVRGYLPSQSSRGCISAALRPRASRLQVKSSPRTSYPDERCNEVASNALVKSVADRNRPGGHGGRLFARQALSGKRPELMSPDAYIRSVSEGKAASVRALQLSVEATGPTQRRKAAWRTLCSALSSWACIQVA